VAEWLIEVVAEGLLFDVDVAYTVPAVEARRDAACEKMDVKRNIFRSSQKDSRGWSDGTWKVTSKREMVDAARGG
jgi:hypothetical protein